MQITTQTYKILSQFSDLLLDFSKLFLSTCILPYTNPYIHPEKSECVIKISVWIIGI